MFITRRNNPFLFNTDEGGIAGQAPETEGTPDTAAEDAAAQTQAEVDWAKRYSDLQPEYTRATQEAAELRRERELYQQMVTSEDPDTRRVAAQELGYQLDDETDDTQEQYLTRQEWQQYQAQQQQQTQEQQRLAGLESYVDQQLAALGVDDEDADWIVQKAINMPTQGPDGQTVPDVKGAFEALKARDLAAQKKWAASKRTHQFSGSGEAGTQALPRDTHEQRVARAMARLQADQ